MALPGCNPEVCVNPESDNVALHSGNCGAWQEYHNLTPVTQPEDNDQN